MTSFARSETAAEALEAAAAMAARGQALAAVDELTRVNQRTRDPAVEARLVELRHQAFGELPRSRGRERWPAAFPDPFPGERGIPTAVAEELSGDLLGGALTHHGCLRVPGLADAETVARLREAIDRAFSARQAVEEGADELADTQAYVRFGPGSDREDVYAHAQLVRAADSPGLLWEIFELYRRRGVTKSVTEYLAERPVMLGNKFLVRRVTTGGGSPDFHQDGAFLGDDIRTVNWWVALTDCGPGTDSPGLDVFPQRFEVLPTGEEPAFLSWTVAKSTILRHHPDAEIHRASFAAGDALCFDERLPHRTGHGVSPTPRHSIESWFAAPSTYPAKHTPIVV